MPVTAKNAPSGVTNVFGLPLSLALLGILFFIAASNASTALATLVATVLVLMVAVRAWGRLGLWRLEVSLSCGSERLFSGESMTLRAEIANRKILPVWMRVELARPDALTPTATEGVGISEIGEMGLPPFGRGSGSWTFRAGRRGVHRLGPATLIAGDLLGLHRRGRLLPFQRDLIVFPRLVPIVDLELPFRDYFGIHPAKGIIEDPAWYEGTREYSGNKPARNIHWKASARLGVMQEKIFEPTSHQKIFFLLDGAGFEDVDEAARFESALEILGSLASRFAETGASFAIATDRRVDGFPAVLPLGRGPEHLGMFLELLARCETVKGQAIMPLLGRMGGGGGAAGYLVLCRSPGESTRKYLALPSTRRDRVQFIFAEGGECGEPFDFPALSFEDLRPATGNMN
jgi:uncharacterized protein (DUF58 family)